MLTECLFPFSCTWFTGGDEHSREESSTCISYGRRLRKATDKAEPRTYFKLAPESLCGNKRDTHCQHARCPGRQGPSRAPRAASFALVSWLRCMLFPPWQLPFLLASVPPGDPVWAIRLSSTPGAQLPRGLLSAEPDPHGPGRTVTLSCHCLPFVSCTQAKWAPCSGAPVCCPPVPGMGSNQSNLLNDGTLEGRNAWRGVGGAGGVTNANGNANEFTQNRQFIFSDL